jgi:hypothetical protein
VRRDDMPFGRAVGEVRAEGLTRLAVVGRLADVPNLGDHRSSDVRASWVVTALAGPRDALPTIEVTHTDGSDLVAAVADASAADAAVVVVGHTAEDEGEHVGSFDPELATLDPPSEDPQALDGHPPWSYTSFTIVGVSQPARVDRLVELARWPIAPEVWDGLRPSDAPPAQ